MNVKHSNKKKFNNIMNKYLFFGLTAGIFSVAGLVSCNLESYEDPVEETYTKQFIKNFGLIDSNQDWNMATRAEVTVNTNEDSRIKVYGEVDSTYHLMGDFDGVSGTKTLQFDTPRGVSNLIVSDGSSSICTTVGQSVDFAALQTRTAYTTDGDDNPLGVKVEYTEEGSKEEYEYFTDNSAEDKTGVYYYRNRLPEKVFNVNASGVDTDFKFSSGNSEYSFIIYPVYWNTSNTITIGVQYTYNGTDYKIPVYMMKSGDELEYYNASGNSWVTIKPSDYDNWPVDKSKTPGNYTEEEKTKAKNFIAELGYTNISAYDFRWDNTIVLTINGKYEAVGNIGESIIEGATKYRSRGIKVTIPAKTEFIIYCTYTYNGELKTSYSVTEKNEEVTYNGETVHVPHIATFLNENGERCIGFEDYYNYYTGPVAEGSEGEPDLNDLIIYTTLSTPDNPTPEIKDPQSYILAAEDLGNIDDFDFNDMVIRVSIPVLNENSADDAHKYKVEVTALAAGGTLPLKVCRNGNVIMSPLYDSSVETPDYSLFHSWFGSGNIASTTMINTYAISTTRHTQTIYLSQEEKENFTMASYTIDVKNKMGGFSFIVDRDGTGAFTNTSEVIAPENGKAPQMICVPGDWKWPTERTNISTAYPDFGAWGKNYENKTWISNYVSGLVLSDK